MVDRLGERHAACDEVVDLDDQVTRFDARAKRRRVLDRRNDADDAVLDADFDAESAEFTLRGDLQFLEGVCIEEVGMRVEPVHHSVDRFLDQLVVRNRLDVIALDLAEHRRQELQILIRNRQARLALREYRKIQAEQESQHRPQPDQTRLLQTIAHRRPRLFVPRPSQNSRDHRMPDAAESIRLLFRHCGAAPLPVCIVRASRT